MENENAEPFIQEAGKKKSATLKTKIYKVLSFVPCSLFGMIMVFFICYLISF